MVLMTSSLRSECRPNFCLSDLKKQRKVILERRKPEKVSLDFYSHSKLSMGREAASRSVKKERTKLKLELVLKKQSLKSETNEINFD